MVKRSYVGEYKPFSEYKMKQLKSAKIFPENAVFTINKNWDYFPVIFGIQNSDIENNTRWPIWVRLTCLSPSQDALQSCTVTNKEVRAGEVMKFEAKIKNSKSEDITHYIWI